MIGLIVGVPGNQCTGCATPSDETWIGLAEGPAFEDYASGSGPYAEQALRRLGDRLRERRGPASGWLTHG